MEIAGSCIPVGALPYDNIKHTTAMMAKLFSQSPFIALLPNLSPLENLEIRTFENIPGIEFIDGKLVLKVGTPEYEHKVNKLEKAFKNPSTANLDGYGFNAEFLEKYFQMIKKFKSKNAYINILGPFTVSQILISAAQEQVLADKNYRKLFVQAVCVKALHIIGKIKKICPETVPVVILEEPLFNQYGMVKRGNQDITPELVVNMFSKVIEKLKRSGAIVGIQCMEKCDWSVPIKAGVDLISFDAYNNPNNLGIIPDIITDFLRKGGMINWGIVPVVSEKMVKGLTIDYLYKRLSATIGGIILAGVPAELLYRHPLVSVNGNTDELPVIFAERAVMMANQLGLRLAAKL